MPRGAGGTEPKKTEKPASTPKTDAPKKPLFSVKPKAAKPKVEAQPKSTPATNTSYSGNKVLPIFWTVASVISMLVNIVVVIVLIVAIQLLGGTKAALDFAQGQANGLEDGREQRGQQDLQQEDDDHGPDDELNTRQVAPGLRLAATVALIRALGGSWT